MPSSRPDHDARGLLPSDLPIRAETHPHWVEMFHLPHKLTLALFAVLLVLAVVDPNPWAWILVPVVGVYAFFRWHVWQGERITLTSKRIIRRQGVAETDWSESSLRLDRISGVWVVQTVPGKLLGYANIEIEAPGSHPATHGLKRLAEPQAFYETLRWLVFGDPPPGSPPGAVPPGIGPPMPPDPDDDPLGYGAAQRYGRPSGPARPPGSPVRRDGSDQYLTQPLPALPPMSPHRPRRGRRAP